MHEIMPLDLFLVFFQQTCPIHYFSSKTHVLDGFVPFCRCTRPIAETSIGVHLMHEFMPPKPFLVCRNEHAQSTISGLKLMFWVVPCHFVAALENRFLFSNNEHAQSTTLGPKLIFRWFRAISSMHPTHCGN